MDAPLLGKLAATAVTETFKGLTKFGVGLVRPSGVADVASAVSKEVVDALLQQTSSIERKIDEWLREPLKSGLTFLA